MSVFEKIFGRMSGQANPPQNPVVATNNPATMPAPQMVPPQGVPPAPTTPAPPEDPLAKFKELWSPEKPTAETPNPGIDPQAILAAAAKIDFTKGLSPELLGKVAAGGEEAVNALTQMMNLVAQQNYAQSTVTTARLVEEAVSKARDEFSAQIPKAMRAQNSRNLILDANPALKDPAIQPLIEAQISQLNTKFPTASPEDLRTMAEEYLVAMAAKIVPQKSAASSGTGKKVDDWSDLG